MRNYLLMVSLLALPNFLFSSSNIRRNKIVFPTGIHSINKDVLSQANKIYNNLHERNYVSIIVKGEFEDQWDASEQKQLAKKRCIGIQNYFVGIGLDQKNVLIDFNGTPKLILFKPRATFQMSGKIDLGEVEQQCFNVNAGRKDYFKTNFGNVFVFEPGVFETEAGIPIFNGDIKVCVWEFSKRTEMVKGQLTSGSNKILETASAFYIQAFHKNKELKVDNPKSYKVYVRHKGESRGYQPYYGKVKNGNVEWVADKKSHVYESMFDEGALYEAQQKNKNSVQFSVAKNKSSKSKDQSRLGNAKQLLLKCKKIGWVNCDRETKVAAPTSLVVKVDAVEEYTVRMLFKTKNIVIPGYSNSNYLNQYEFKKVPDGEEVIVVAYMKSGSGYKVAFNEVNLGYTKALSITPKWISQNDFNVLISKWGY